MADVKRSFAPGELRWRFGKRSELDELSNVVSVRRRSPPAFDESSRQGQSQ
jgi:hypothetical protein